MIRAIPMVGRYATDVPQNNPAPTQRRSPETELKQIKPLDPPMVPFVLVGMAIWGLLALILLPFRDQLNAHGHGEWIRICIAGIIVALPGLGIMIIHDRNRKRRRAKG